MKAFALTFGLLLLSSPAPAKDLLVNAGGKDMAVQYSVVNREISEKDRDRGSQKSAIAKVRL